MSELKDSDNQSTRYKTGAYTPFTDCYGAFMGNFNQVSEHYETIDDAKMKVKQLNSRFKQWNSSKDKTESTEYFVKELELDQCNLPLLKQIARRENISIFQKSKKQLKEILKPIITHKKHLNCFQETDLDECELCISGKAEEYDKKQQEMNNNPEVIKSRAINKMYRKSMQCPINESDVIKQFGLSHDDIEKAVIAQKIHFQRRSYFGNSYLRYERNEVIKYCNDLKKELEKDSKKRKLEEINDSENGKETICTKKRKIDYKGVPERFISFKWLYTDCDELSDDNRNKIVRYLSGEYNKNDVDSEDVLLKRVEINNVKERVVKETVFRMLFKDKKWKKLIITKKKKSL